MLDDAKVEPLATSGENGSGLSAVAGKPIAISSLPPIESDHLKQNDHRLKANAGDDQLARVGHQLTLNGSQSTPKGSLGYRWIQLSGPTIKLKMEDGPLYSFVPSEPGLYKFGLIVALEGSISRPDEVEVRVFPTDNEKPQVLPTLFDNPPANTPTLEAERIDRLVSAALDRIPNAEHAAEPIYTVLDSIQSRIRLYPCFTAMYRELSLQLDENLPKDPSLKALWIDLLFRPLTEVLIESMHAEGLDLRDQNGQNMSFSRRQRDVLERVFRSISRSTRGWLDQQRVQSVESQTQPPS